jgi:hypothetical protein
MLIRKTQSSKFTLIYIWKSRLIADPQHYCVHSQTTCSHVKYGFRVSTLFIIIHTRICHNIAQLLFLLIELSLSGVFGWRL